MSKRKWSLHSLDVRDAALFYRGEAKGSYGEAARLMQQDLPASEFKSRHVATQFVRDQRRHFKKYHSIASQYDTRPPPNKKKVADDLAKQCAAALKQGFMKEIKVTYKTETTGKRGGKKGRKKTVTVAYRDYYHDIDTACKELPLLRDTVEKCQVEPAQLLGYMEAVDIDLVIRTRDMKKWLNPDQEEARRKAAVSHLKVSQEQGDSELESTVFVDEFGVWMQLGKGPTKVYCDRHDPHVHDVVPLIGLRPGKKIKIHILAAVNYHLGAFFMEFTTGTTDIQRLHHDPPAAYKVKTRGKKKKARVAKGTTQEEFEDVMQVLVQTAKEQLGDLGIKDVRFQYDNNRIQAGARLERMGMDKASKLKLPKYSPDMNKPIEHVFSPLKSNIMKQLRKLEAKQLTAQKAQSIAIKCFSDLKKESIQRDIKSLPLTWQAIAADKGSSVDSGKRRPYFGTAGGYPVAKLR